MGKAALHFDDDGLGHFVGNDLALPFFAVPAIKLFCFFWHNG